MKKVPQVFQLIFDSQFTAKKGQMTHCNYESLLYIEQHKRKAAYGNSYLYTVGCPITTI